MITKRITNNMTGLDIICVLGNGNPGAMNVLADNKFSADIRQWSRKVNLLDDLNIYGTDIWTLYQVCCNDDIELLNHALDLLLENVLPSSDFVNNLALNKPVEIFDESSRDILKYKAEKSKHKDFYKHIKDSFVKRFNKARENEMNPNLPQPGSEE